MTRICCNRDRCLNNKFGICTADTIEYEGICKSYITTNDAKKRIVEYVEEHMVS